MKRENLFLIGALFVSMNVSAQLININPDPNGEPWTIGPGNGLGDASATFKANPEALLQILDQVDNSQEIFFYKIFNQSPPPLLYNSCAQAAGVTYTFGYEINRVKNADGDSLENVYSPSYTWDYLNWGTNQGSWTKEGWDIILDNGCPNLSNWGNFYDTIAWMDGYEKYESGIWNRIKDYGTDSSYVDIHIPYDNTLNDLKTWICNHNQPGAASGGLAVFSKFMTGYTTGHVYGTNDLYLKSWGTSGSHEMTIVGYDDDVDCWTAGIGAFLVANTWGPSGFGNQGFIWLPYSLVTSAGLLASGIVEVEERQPSVIAKIRLKHSARNHLDLSIDITDDPYARPPSNYTKYAKSFKAMKFKAGGSLPMNGEADIPITIAYDLSDYVNENFSEQEFPRLKFILGIREAYDNNNEYNGEIYDFSILDYREDPNHPFEVYSHDHNVIISDNGIYNMTVDYFVLPTTIKQSDTLDFNCIVRDNVTIKSPYTITYSGRHLDFYDNGNLNIEAGANLNFNSNVSISAQRENGTISVFGGLLWNNFVNVNYRTIGCHFSLYLENPNLEFTMNQCTFRGTLDVKQSEIVTISNSNFIGSDIHNNYGDINIQNNTLTNSTIHIMHPHSLTSSCEITGNSFNNNVAIQSSSVITIEDYPNFLIENCTINYAAKQGIELFYAGWNVTGNHAVRHNTIHFTGTAYPVIAELGIHSYFSNSAIENNHISNNDYGITGFHGSNLSIIGVSSAQDDQHTQLIEDNTVSQCIFSYGSFPFAFHYNVLKDLSTGNKPFIKAVDYEEILPDTNQNRDLRGNLSFNVEYNCWRDDIDPTDRLLPLGAYDWSPTWCPGGGHLKSDDIAETLYYQAMNNIEEGNFTEAESGFNQIIAEYPENNFAQASLKSLFGLNPSLHDTDYTFVKAYCDSLSMNPGDSLLGKTAEWLSIHCNIRDKQYQQAINSLDSIIYNPGTLADSVFALIDLSYVFNEANNGSGSKSPLVTKHPGIIPESQIKYLIQRKEWIDLLLKLNDDSAQGSITENELDEDLKPGKISSIHPNPSNGIFTIDYTLAKKILVSLSILSSSGQTIAEIQKGELEKGEYHELISDLELPVGIYFIKLSLDKVITDAGKLIITK